MFKIADNPPVLDPCCGSRMFWFDRADPRATFGDVRGYPWRPSIHMPRWASRLTLTVTDVRVQRLQEITIEDARHEGIPEYAEDASLLGMPGVGGQDGCEWDNRTSVENFASLWNSLHGPGAWDANPWVAAYTFTVQRGNIDNSEVA